jgi:hypothetical protein
MTPGIGNRQVREIVVDVEKGRARNVSGEIELPPASGIPELPAAVDEADERKAQLPPSSRACGTTATTQRTRRLSAG